jgi:hypothetical protein
MSATSDNAQGTLAATAGTALGVGATLIGTSIGQTQEIGAVIFIAGILTAIVRAWLRAP